MLEDRPGTSAPLEYRCGFLGGGPRAPLHPDPVVTVTGDRVESSQLVRVLVDDHPNGVQGCSDMGGSVVGLGGCLGNSLLFQFVFRCLDCDERIPADRPAAECRGVRGRQPQAFQLLINPEQGEGYPGHVEAGAELADLRVDQRDARFLEEVSDAREHHKKFFGFHRTETVQYRYYPGAVDGDAGRNLVTVQQALHKQFGEAVGGRDVDFVDSRFAVDAEPNRHPPLGNGEQRFVRARQSAAGERHTHRPGALVGKNRDALHLVEVTAFGCCRTSDFEHREVTGDAAAFVGLAGRRAKDVVRHRDGSAVDAVGAHGVLCGGEVQHVAGIVAVTEECPATLLTRANHRFDLVG